ncbi:aspartyl/asparaginyl beta-hydroxylase domain-containing protein [Sphingomonas sp. AOB5]|uniref:aspartyl/asparaginyl beta-hydroxylase domain-containing protein n=1 Tax=Sphingomonas sp. AOB5 TaxID=3034017 RepID=UPI0023F9C711|nr:aspartyl/asparaginyl beta-hydroxylase domain-containing protein [Sphingomonas sp. AOB5]MDF7775024.1 aspartyl/asparaginyl beta-hydroxylase domain-containing protein [Sphingomonas sp. AOB5]
MQPFTAIANGLDIGPALDELAANPWFWMSPNANALLEIPLLSGDYARELETTLPELWKLIDTALAHVAKAGDTGMLAYCRAGLIPPGAGIPPHFDGIDGVTIRRYQLALASEPGVALVVDGETRRFEPGELWQIDVSKVHSVHNGSQADRITVLFDTAAG